MLEKVLHDGQWAFVRTIMLYDMNSLNNNTNLRLQTFRYWAVRATDDWDMGSSPFGEWHKMTLTSKQATRLHGKQVSSQFQDLQRDLQAE